jgi:hypothetical protein
MSLFLLMVALAMFMVGCDTTSQPLPSGAPDATSGDVGYEPPAEEQEGQPATEGDAEPAEEAPAEEAPAEPEAESSEATETPGGEG